VAPVGPAEAPAARAGPAIWPCGRPLTNNSVFIYHIHIHVKPHLSRARQAAAGA
jgi:hypothetical protein